MSRSNNSEGRRVVDRPRSRCALFVLCGACFLGATGCGADFNEFLRQSAASGGRVLVDIFLTDLANALAEIGEQNDAPPDPVDDDTDDPGDAPPPGDLEPDAVEGEAIFVANNCAACHCADAAGGCALSAPSLINVPVEMLEAILVGDAPHTGGKFGLSQQDLVDLEAYLADLGG